MGEKVLVVDDNNANRSMMADVLDHWGYRVIEAAQGMEAVERAREELPDIVLLDVMLPGMNGYEVCRQLKEDRRLERVPVVMLTVLDDSEARIRALNVGADLFINKPPNYKELRKNIESLLVNSKKFREMESLDALIEFLDALLGLLAADIRDRYRAVSALGLRTAKLLSLGEDACRRLTLCGLLCAMETAAGAPAGSAIEMIRPLSLARWMEGYLTYQRNPVVANGADGVPVVHYICERYHRLTEEGLAPEEALSRLEGAVAGHPAQERALEALAQTIRDEMFLSSLTPGNPSSPGSAGV